MNHNAFSIGTEVSRSRSSLLIWSLRKTASCLLLASVLVGCETTNIKAPTATLSRLKSVLVVSVESPPLEVLPDPIETRIPVYEHYRNMTLPFELDTKLYQNAGGIILAGQVSSDEKLNRPLAAHSKQSWTPSQAIAQLARNQLSTLSLQSTLKNDDLLLPMPTEEHNANLHHWHQAIKSWYASNKTTADYRHIGNYDAVLEIGVDRYRIFEGQTSLQVLLKLINPNTGQVIARSRANSFEVDDAALHSLNSDSQAFKKRIKEMGEHLLSQALSDIGWHTTDTLATVSP